MLYPLWVVLTGSQNGTGTLLLRSCHYFKLVSRRHFYHLPEYRRKDLDAVTGLHLLVTRGCCMSQYSLGTCISVAWAYAAISMYATYLQPECGFIEHLGRKYRLRCVLRNHFYSGYCVNALEYGCAHQNILRDNNSGY